MEEGLSPLGRASPSKRAGFHLAFTWEKPAVLPGLACLLESPGPTTFILTQNQNLIFAYKFSFYNPGRNPKQHPVRSCRMLQDPVRILKLTGS